MRTAAHTIITLGLAALLSACGMPRMIDSDVENFTGTVAAAPAASYRFERLPSQAQNTRQDALEAMATQALGDIGLTLSTSTAARYLVQLSASVIPFDHPSVRAPFIPPGVGVSVGVGTPGVFLGFGGLSSFAMAEPPWYAYTVHLVLRDATSHAVAYETRARHEGPWSDSARILPVVMQSALRDYPSACGCVQRVVIELPARGADGQP